MLYLRQRDESNIMQKYGIVNTDTLNLRSSPSTTARIISQLPKGSVLEIVSDPGIDWLEVQPDGTTNRGFVSKTYLTLTDVKPGPGVPTSGKAEVTTDNLNVRSGPGTGYAVLSVAARGT